MTDTRYFYTDPLAAAWMAKNFGMRLRPDCYGERPLLLGEDVTRFEHPRFGGKFYIHTDSLPVLEPMIGDKDADGLVYRMCGYHDKLSWVDRYDNFCHEESRTSIREGKPFMWPESEPNRPATPRDAGSRPGS